MNVRKLEGLMDPKNNRNRIILNNKMIKMKIIMA